MSGGLILIIDDDKAVRTGLELAFKGEGFEIDLASHGASAIEKVRAHKPSLIILDYAMPDMNGLEILRGIRDIDQDGLIPVLMISGYANNVQIRQGLNLGATDFISKPFNMSHLMKTVSAVMKGDGRYKQVEGFFPTGRLAAHSPITKTSPTNSESKPGKSAASGSDEKWIGPDQIARLLNVHATTVQRCIDAGRFQSYRTLGGHRRVKFSEVMEAIEVPYRG
ncbi:MAG: response regulator, partial [Candidatus Lindowbacteria bacterium]|nr:response regulator [Candidatus Lindowbacteria bacterium]